MTFYEKDKNKEQINRQYTLVLDNSEGKTTINTMVSLYFQDNMIFFLLTWNSFFVELYFYLRFGLQPKIFSTLIDSYRIYTYIQFLFLKTTVLSSHPQFISSML